MTDPADHTPPSIEDHLREELAQARADVERLRLLYVAALDHLGDWDRRVGELQDQLAAVLSDDSVTTVAAIFSAALLGAFEEAEASGDEVVLDGMATARAALTALRAVAGITDSGSSVAERGGGARADGMPATDEARKGEVGDAPRPVGLAAVDAGSASTGTVASAPAGEGPEAGTISSDDEIEDPGPDCTATEHVGTCRHAKPGASAGVDMNGLPPYESASTAPQPVPYGHCNRCPRCGCDLANVAYLGEKYWHQCEPCFLAPLRSLLTHCAGCGAPFETDETKEGT